MANGLKIISRLGILVFAVTFLSGCGNSEAVVQTNNLDLEFAEGVIYEYPYEVIVVGENSVNNVSDFKGGIEGTLYVHDDGSVTGDGAIVYDEISACEWEPPYPEGQEPPYCELMGSREGSVSVSGAVTSYAGVETEIDDAIHITALQLGNTKTVPWTPGTLELQFQLIEPSYEELEFWGYADGERKPADTAGFTLVLQAVGLFDESFEVAPILIGDDDSAEFWDAGTHTFEGASGIANGVATFYITE